MPYIQQDLRKSFDEAIAKLVEKDICPGELNYVITKIIDGVMMKNEVNYALLAALVGELECVKQELYRRIAAPYEDIKIEKNGDVYSTQIPAR